MNILYIHNVAKVGGAEQVTLQIIKGLDLRRDVPILVTPEDGDFVEKAKRIGAKTSILKMVHPDIRKPLNTFCSFVKILLLLITKRVTLIHVSDVYLTRIWIAPAKFLRIPIVLHVHFPVDQESLDWIFWIKPYRLSFLFCCEDIKEKVIKNLKPSIKPRIIKVIYNSVDADLFGRPPSLKRTVGKDLCNIGIVGNLQERKGHKDLILATKILKDDGLKIKVHVIGGDIFGEKQEDALKSLAGSLGLLDTIVFHGQVSNVKDYLSELDIFVCASHEEAFPVSILEAMATELPIVSTNVNGIPEALVSERNAILVGKGNPKDLAAALKTLIENPKKASSIAQNAKNDVRSRFCEDKFHESVNLFYKKVLNETNN